jgi:di/tricarboxylate transporter
MTTSEWTLIGVFLATIALMFGTRLRPDVVAILAALSLGLLGVIPDGAVFQGLSSTVVMTLIGLFILAEGLEDTGVIRWAAQRLAMLGGGGSERRLLLTLMATAAVLSLGMSNVAVGALFIPASSRVARASGVPLSGLLLPVSYASLLGGMATIFTSANIIMSDLLIQQGSMPLGMMDFALTGGLVAVAGVTYMLVAGHRFLPERDRDVEDPNGDFFGLYKLGERFWEFEVTKGSPLEGKTIEDVGFGARFGVSVLAIRRRHRTFLVPGPGIAILPGDRIVVLGHEDRVREVVQGVELRTGISPAGLQDDLELIEIVVPPRSRAAGRTLTDLALRSKHGVTVLALWRGGRIIRTDVGKIPLEVGDGLLVMHLPERLHALTRGGDFLLAGSRMAAPEQPERAPLALAIFGLVVAVAFTGLLPIGETALAGAMTMVLTGCVSMERAYRSIEWHVIFLVAGLLPLGFAMIDTGLAARLAGALGGALADGRPLTAVGIMFLVSVAATQVIGGQVSALLVGPVALAVAETVSIAPQPMAVAVAIGASTAFLTPMAHPVNAMMIGAGGYVPRDFVRVGTGMTLVTLLSLLAAMWLIWGVR